MHPPKRIRTFEGRPLKIDAVLCETFIGYPCPEGGRPEMWKLYLRPKRSSPTWLTLKLLAVGRVAHKGNYWVAWSMREKRFNGWSDSGSLRHGRPQLFAEVVHAVVALVEKFGNPLLGDIVPGYTTYRGGHLPPAPVREGSTLPPGPPNMRGFDDAIVATDGVQSPGLSHDNEDLL